MVTAETAVQFQSIHHLALIKIFQIGLTNNYQIFVKGHIFLISIQQRRHSSLKSILEIYAHPKRTSTLTRYKIHECLVSRSIYNTATMFQFLHVLLYTGKDYHKLQHIACQLHCIYTNTTTRICFLYETICHICEQLFLFSVITVKNHCHTFHFFSSSIL